MNKWQSKTRATFIFAASLALVSTGLSAAEIDKAVTPATAVNEGNLTIGIANFRKCVEESQKGKQETAALEAMQAQMESSLQELQKQLNEISAKLNDADYLDGITQAAENDLKHKQRTLSQEYQMMQQQFIQALQQANMRVLQNLADSVSQVAKEVAQSKQLDLILNEEAAFYFHPSLDVSVDIVARLNKKFEDEAKAQEKK